MTEVWLKILWISGTTSVVLLPLLLCAGKISARYRAKSCYFLWLVLCLRLLIPVQFSVTEPVVTIELPRGEMHISDEHSQTTDGVQSEATAGSFRQLSLLEGTAMIWLAGFGGVLAWHGLAYGRVRQRLRRNGVILQEDRDLAKELGSSVIVVRTSVDTPMTMGLLKPIIFLPKEISQEDLPYILQHEICHLHRKDLWYKSLFLLCSAVHWFNPLVWKLDRVAGNNLELCCDETVVAGRSGEYRRCYGQILLRSAADPKIPLSTALGSGNIQPGMVAFLTGNRMDKSAIEGTDLILTLNGPKPIQSHFLFGSDHFHWQFCLAYFLRQFCDRDRIRCGWQFLYLGSSVTPHHSPHQQCSTSGHAYKQHSILLF